MLTEGQRSSPDNFCGTKKIAGIVSLRKKFIQYIAYFTQTLSAQAMPIFLRLTVEFRVSDSKKTQKIEGP